MSKESDMILKKTLKMENVNTNSPSVLELEHDQIPSPPSPSASSTTETGGWRSVRYIIGNESFEKLASMSLISNLTVYLLTEYNLSGIFVVNVVQLWNGSSNIASIIGAFISDTYLGRFRTLFYGSIASLLGILTITLTAGIHQLRPLNCKDRPYCEKPKGWQLGVLFGGLGLLSIGAGGIRPCNIAFGADQFDTNTEKGRGQLESFFNWWYFTFTIALVVALTGVVYVQTNVSWTLGFAIPTLCLAFSISIFLLGRNTYICKKPRGSIFSDMAKVIVAAYRKRNLQASGRTFYNPAPTFGESYLLVQTDRFKFFDKAAIIVDPSELNDQGMPRNAWRLCSLQQVEHLKCLLGILPVWVTGICGFIVMDQQNTFGVLQVIQSKRSIGPHFKIPPGWMNLISMIALSLWIYIYECIYIPLARKTRKRTTRLTIRQRIRIGILLSILCMLVAAVVEKKRRDLALRFDSFISPMSFVLLLPQFALSGLNEAFAAVSIMEFFTLQMPESMRTVAGAVFFLSLSIANYTGSLIVNIVHKATSQRGKKPWLGGHDLNQNRLDYYYYIIAALGALNFFYFNFFASSYLMSSKGTTGTTEVQPGMGESSEPYDEEKVLDITGTGERPPVRV
ncbi:protein NRT1/ PTR FAMILY 2.8-like [Gastrolobium bilobum]|uniref:protein NRT1/ PTR FAMILY 2.8-like n=1 Tax=Gastrolobium bilobum TaxID=150636 RepID=UPI002AB10B6C|nr:protein NRT1/ PTR FAMILY 2.8-like [Gastrolobium bilobum]